MHFHFILPIFIHTWTFSRCIHTCYCREYTLQRMMTSVVVIGVSSVYGLPVWEVSPSCDILLPYMHWCYHGPLVTKQHHQPYLGLRIIFTDCTGNLLWCESCDSLVFVEFAHTYIKFYNINFIKKKHFNVYMADKAGVSCLINFVHQLQETRL